MAVCNDQAEALSFACQVAVIRDGRLAHIGALVRIRVIGQAHVFTTT